MEIATITSRNPIHSHMLTALYKGKRYDINTKVNRVVKMCFKPTAGSYTSDKVSKKAKAAIITAATLYNMFN